MAHHRTGLPTIRAARVLFDLGPIGDLSDGQLLERCTTDRTEGAELAFAALVKRHEGLVWRVCRGILRDRHDAEEAFQATFVVLIRRARALWVRDSLGPWLHEVAARTALRHRAAIQRRRAREARRADRSTATAMVASGVPAVDLDLVAALHEELARLPATLRAPLVLCDLEGSTHAEAARSLGWPIGTVKSRQTRGRRTLAARLARRGFVSLGVGSLADLGSFGAIAPRSAADLAARPARVGFVSLHASPSALRLARETLNAMLWIKLRPVAVALTLGLASTAVGFVSSAQEPGPPSAPAADPPTAAGPARQPAEDAGARLRLRVQEIATRRARIAYDQARLSRELAELAVAEAEEIVHPQQLAAANGAVTRAEAALADARDLAERSAAAIPKGAVPGEQAIIDRLKFDKAKFHLEQAQTNREVMTRYTQELRLKAFRSEVEKARVDESAKESSWKLEQSKLEALRPRVSVNFDGKDFAFAIGAFW